MKKTASTPAAGRVRRRRKSGHIALLDRRQFTWELPGRPAARQPARADADVHITEHAPANLHVDLVLDNDGDSFLWVGITDQNNPPAYQLCYAVIGGDVLLDAARAIVANRRKGGAR